MRHHVDKPQAGKNQQDHENQSNRIHDHAMSIIIDAFRAFVFREVWDWCPPEVTSVRGSRRSRPESYDTAVSFIKVPGNHGDISPYLSGAGFAPRPQPRYRFGEPWHCDEITLGDKPRQTSPDRPGFLMQPVLRRHDRVSEHWARLGIVPLKIDHRTCGRLASFADSHVPDRNCRRSHIP